MGGASKQIVKIRVFKEEMNKYINFYSNAAESDLPLSKCFKRYSVCNYCCQIT